MTKNPKHTLESELEESGDSDRPSKISKTEHLILSDEEEENVTKPHKWTHGASSMDCTYLEAS